jgi:tRNA G18 (ribose-2'-O)-methylase SpoU
VVRGSMGAIFRLAISIADPAKTQEAALAAGVQILGLATSGAPLAEEQWEGRTLVVVGHERQGLGRWKNLCARVLTIPMSGRAESLSAAVAGSIALYESSCKRALP